MDVLGIDHTLRRTAVRASDAVSKSPQGLCPQGLRTRPGHEMGFCGDSFKSRSGKTCIDVVTDVVTVKGFMEDAPEIFHHR